MVEDFQGNVKGDFNFKELEQKAKQAEIEKHLKVFNEGKKKEEEEFANSQIINPVWYKFMIIFSSLCLIGLLTVGGFSVYYLNQGKFQSNINTEVNPMFNQTITSNTQNTFNNNFQTNLTTTIVLPKELTDALIKAVNKTNST